MRTQTGEHPQLSTCSFPEFTAKKKREAFPHRPIYSTTVCGDSLEHKWCIVPRPSGASPPKITLQLQQSRNRRQLQKSEASGRENPPAGAHLPNLLLKKTAFVYVQAFVEYCSAVCGDSLEDTWRNRAILRTVRITTDMYTPTSYVIRQQQET